MCKRDHVWRICVRLRAACRRLTDSGLGCVCCGGVSMPRHCAQAKDAGVRLAALKLLGAAATACEEQFVSGVSVQEMDVTRAKTLGRQRLRG